MVFPSGGDFASPRKELWEAAHPHHPLFIFTFTSDLASPKIGLWEAAHSHRPLFLFNEVFSDSCVSPVDGASRAPIARSFYLTKYFQIRVFPQWRGLHEPPSHAQYY